MEGGYSKGHLLIQPYLHTESNKIFLKQVELLKLSEFLYFILIFLSMINALYYYSILKYT